MDIALMNAHLSASRSIVLSEMDKRIIIEKVTQALMELTALTVNNLFWAASPIDEGYVLDWEKYSTIFPKSSYMTSTCSLFESSIGSAAVPLKASDLAGMFLDMDLPLKESLFGNKLDSPTKIPVYISASLLLHLVLGTSVHLSKQISKYFILSVERMNAGNNSKMGKGKAPRHTPHQIQQLEAFFMECRNPNESQRRQLSNELGLGQNQIKFWFQNKRNQTKVHKERLDNTTLRLENERLQYENLALSERLKNVICPVCDDHPPMGKEERQFNIEKLKMENAELREEYERIANEITNRTGKPISHLLSLPPESLENLLNSPAETFLGQQSGNSSTGPCIGSTNYHNPIAANVPIEISEDDKIMMTQNAAHYLNELAYLLLKIEPYWVMSPTYGGYVLHDGNYSKNIHRSRQLKCTSFRIESSKDTAVVPIPASHLVEMFLDTSKWADLFPTIVMEAKVIETLDTGSLGGSLHLMYERTHILSSLVAPREFVFLRYCKQRGPDTWLIMDASHDKLPTRSWMFPSGVMIENLPDGKSMVTWVDHVGVDKSLNDPLYRNVLSSVHGYGAKRWLSTLERMIKRSLHSLCPGGTSSLELVEGMNNFEGRINIMMLSNRMIRDLCAILSMPDRSDLSESTNGKIRISVRENSEPGQPHGMIVAASTSLWLPLTFENLFNFLRDGYRRHEWDLMLNRSPVNEIALMPTGPLPGNSVSIIRPYIFKEQKKLLLQENSIDPLGALIVFANVESEVIKAVMNGNQDSSKISVLPCGFLISSDGTPSCKGSGGASTRMGIGSKPFGSLLTLAFQLSVGGDAGSIQIQKAAANTLNYLLTSIIHNIKVAFGCTELD